MLSIFHVISYYQLYLNEYLRYVLLYLPARSNFGGALTTVEQPPIAFAQPPGSRDMSEGRNAPGRDSWRLVVDQDMINGNLASTCEDDDDSHA